MKTVSYYIKRVFIFPVKLYQLLISPFFPGSCRHEPTCSNYTIQAIEEWGPIRGIYMGIRRLLKCHPWGTSGYDPVKKKR
jgi:putative membrane protein insertion efficiency factor